MTYFAGIVQTPITNFVIVTEMTDDHALVVPLMLGSAIGFATLKLVYPEGIHYALAHDFVTANAATHRFVKFVPDPRLSGAVAGGSPPVFMQHAPGFRRRVPGRSPGSNRIAGTACAVEPCRESLADENRRS